MRKKDFSIYMYLQTMSCLHILFLFSHNYQKSANFNTYYIEIHRKLATSVAMVLEIAVKFLIYQILKSNKK